MKLVIKTTAMTRLLDVLQNNNKNLAEALLQKAAGHKYIYRRPAKRPAKGRKWDYVYPEDLLHPIKTIKKLWGIDETMFNDDYKKNNIKKDFGADKKTFAAHILEYFTNKTKWDLFFSKKENRKKRAFSGDFPAAGGRSLKPFTGETIDKAKDILTKAVSAGEIDVLTCGLWESQMNKSIGKASFAFAPDFVAFMQKKCV